MIIRIFSSNRPSGFILIPLVVIGIRLMPFFRQVEPDAGPVMPLYEMLRTLYVFFPHFAELSAMLLLSMEAIILNRIVIDIAIFKKQSWLPALFFVVLMSVEPKLLSLHPILPAGLFLMLAMNKITGLHKNEGIKSTLFDSGILISIASLFYFPSIVLFLWVAASYFTFRNFNWKEFLIVLIGGGLPYLFFSVYFFWIGQMNRLIPVNPYFHVDTSFFSTGNPVYLALVGIILFLLLVSLYRLFGNTAFFNVRQRKTATTFIWFIVASFTTVFLGEPYPIILALSAVVVSVLFAQLFLSMQRWVAEAFFSGIAGMILYLHYFCV